MPKKKNKKVDKNRKFEALKFAKNQMTRVKLLLTIKIGWK